MLCCEPVLGDLWVASGNKVILLDTHLLTFQVRETSDAGAAECRVYPPVVQYTVKMSLYCLSRCYFHCRAAAPSP